MGTNVTPTRKRPVNPTIGETLVTQARAYTNNLPATMELSLAEFVVAKQGAPRDRQPSADTCAADWNSVHASIGSFADQHSPL